MIYDQFLDTTPNLIRELFIVTEKGATFCLQG